MVVSTVLRRIINVFFQDSLQVLSFGCKSIFKPLKNLVQEREFYEKYYDVIAY